MREQLIAVGIAVFAAACPVRAQQGPAASSKPAVARQATVVSVTGHVEKLPAVRQGERVRWVAVKAGEKLDELTIIRTGLRSKVVLRFEDRGEVTVNNATKVGIAEFRKRGRMVTTRLGLKYGTMRATVDTSRGPTDMRISTPVATLSVRGSLADIAFTGDRGLGLRGRAGVWRVAVGTRTRDVVAGESTDGMLTAAIDILQQERYTQTGDAFGLSGAEETSLINNPPALNPSTPAGGRPIDSAAGPTRVPSEPVRQPKDHIIIGM